jgi:hypothetical protein
MLLQRTTNAYKVVFSILLVALSFGIAQKAEALTISPARIEINGNPGAIVGGNLTLINEQNTTETFYSSYENFTAQGETGAPAFSTDKVGLDTWITVNPSQVTLGPGKSTDIPYSISIPKDTDPGGYFATIFWTNTPPASDSSPQVSIGAKVGALVLLTVNGDVKESAGITQFDRDGHGFFYTTLPVDFRYKFRNDGGDRVEPVGTMTIRDTVFIPAAQLDANPEEGNVLPDSTREFTLEWLTKPATGPVSGFFNAVQYEWQNFAIGLYSAHLSLAYGTKALHATKTTWFFVLPWQLIICIVAGLVIIWSVVKGMLNRYKKKILKEAGIKNNRDNVQG